MGYELLLSAMVRLRLYSSGCPKLFKNSLTQGIVVVEKSKLVKEVDRATFLGQ